MTPIVIDLSHHNVIPSSLEPAKQAGIIGCIHKATEGASWEDSKVDSREYLARQAGLLFGLYHFLSADVDIEAQVDNFLSVYKRYGRKDIVVALDYEKNSNGKTPSLNEVQAWLEQAEVVFKRKPLLYSGNALKEALGGIKHEVLNGDKYTLWLAQYGTTAKLPVGWSYYLLWQYSDAGKIEGVTPPTDVNTGDPELVKQYWTVEEEPVPEPVSKEEEYRLALEDIRDRANSALGG